MQIKLTEKQARELVSDLRQGKKAIEMVSQGFATISGTGSHLLTDLSSQLAEGMF